MWGSAEWHCRSTAACKAHILWTLLAAVYRGRQLVLHQLPLENLLVDCACSAAPSCPCQLRALLLIQRMLQSMH